MSNESSNKKETANSYNGHMWMMAICCGLPIIGFLAIAPLSFSLPTLELALFVICAIGMMVMVNRNSCEKSENNNSRKPYLTLDNLEYAKIFADVDHSSISQTRKLT